MNDLGVVAIGRNEGERLRRCLEVLGGQGVAVVYVDSGSTDGSVATARSLGAEVVELDLTRPFTAARARNAGFERLIEVEPGVEFVQFLDGDCEIAEGWLDRARRVLRDRPEAAVVFGRRRERFPDRSIYNRLADIEWNAPIGGARGETVDACGGDAAVRARALQEVGGYEPSIPAGEEPEFCQRLRHKGWLVLRLDADMTWHDSAMVEFRQWARRQVRTGYGGLDFSTRFGLPGSDPFRRQILSARVWTLGWPAAVALAGALGTLAAGVVALAPLAQAVRIGWRNREKAGGVRPGLAYGALTVLSKGFQMAGQLLYVRDRLAGRHARLIEYKSATPTDTAKPATVAS